MMNSRLSFLGIPFLLLALADFPITVSAAPVNSKAAEHSKNAFNREVVLQHRLEVHDWLNSEAVTSGLDSPINVVVSEGERLDIDLARDEVPERVGLTKAVSRKITFGDVKLRNLKGRALARAHGALKETDDGGYVFTAALRSSNATAIRVHFTGFQLPENAGVYLYTEDGQVFGPYTGRGPHSDGDFWSHTVMGEQVTLQLRYIGTASDEDLMETSFSIAGLAHIRPRFLGGRCSNNASCVESLACQNGQENSAVDDAKMAVAHMQWVSGPYLYICSGGLIADTDTSSEIPYFLSANHCVSTRKDARNLETFFQLDGSCATNCADVYDHRAKHPQDLRVLGAKIKSKSGTSDYTLFELKEDAPGGSVFLGWNADPVAFENNTVLYRISHPDGSPQAYSKHVVDTSKITCGGWPRGNWIYSRDTYGAIEGGSSGSPVVNSVGEVVGQLSGTCGYNISDACDPASNATVDGAFANYFDDIAQFLDPDTSCTPASEICNDGLDNDCDGLVDGDDVSDCPNDGLPAGSSCTSNSQCLSGRCKGKRNNKVCK